MPPLIFVKKTRRTASLQPVFATAKRSAITIALVPTKSAAKVDLDTLPAGERNVLSHVATRLLQAVAEPYRYAETVVTAECAGHKFTAKGKQVLDCGWRAYGAPMKKLRLPEGLTNGQTLAVNAVQIKQGQTKPPEHFIDGSILASMETAGAKNMPDDAERKGIGTPATRAGILEKLVNTDLVERKKAKKFANLLPTQTGTALIAVLPETLKSPLLTAEWEQRLSEVEHGTLEPTEFMEGITSLVTDLVQTYQPIPGSETLFPTTKERIDPCPRCGGSVTESKKGFFCQNPACKFALWKEDRFFTAKKKALTKNVAAALLNEGKVQLKDCWSEKTGKAYDATVFLTDDGVHTNYKLIF